MVFLRISSGFLQGHNSDTKAPVLYFGHTACRNISPEKALMLDKLNQKAVDTKLNKCFTV